MPSSIAVAVAAAPSSNVSEPPIRCAACSMHALLCLTVGASESSVEQFERIVSRRRRIPRHEYLYHMGEPFSNIYAVRLGHFKTYQINIDGGQQITGFQMPGDLLGLDAICTGQYHGDAVALEDSEVCEIPFSRLQELFSEAPALLRQFHRKMSQEIARDQRAMMLLGNMRAKIRFASFLVNLSTRYQARGYSSNRFRLRMSREDIGNYLGMANETISRLLSDFKQHGWLDIHYREIELLDCAVLQTLADGAEVCD